MQSQDDIGLLYEIGGVIIILVFSLLIVQFVHLYFFLWASYNRQPLVFRLPERDESHNV